MTAAPPEIGFRPLGADDVDDILELNQLCDIAETGAPDHEVVQWIRDCFGDYSAFGVYDEHGLAAAGWVEIAPGHVGYEGDVRVRPGVDPSVGDPILAELRKVAAAADPKRPLHFFANASAERPRAWLESRGGSLIRHFWRMQIDLRVAPPEPAVAPPGITIRTVVDDEDDLRKVFTVVDTSFQDHFGHEPGRTFEKWLANVRKRSGVDLSTWWLAELDGEPVAALIGWTMPHAEHERSGLVGTLGTLRAARGRGVGTALLRTAFAEFDRRGLPVVTLGVDAANPTGAVRLYESVGMSVAHNWVLYEIPPLGVNEE